MSVTLTQLADGYSSFTHCRIPGEGGILPQDCNRQIQPALDFRLKTPRSVPSISSLSASPKIQFRLQESQDGNTHSCLSFQPTLLYSMVSGPARPCNCMNQFLQINFSLMYIYRKKEEVLVVSRV